MSFWAEICIHTSFFAIFLTTFYFFFVTFIQTDSLVNDFFNMIKPALVSIASLSSIFQVKALDNVITMSLEEGSKLDDTLVIRNKQIAFNTIVVVGTLSGVLLLLGIFLQYRSGGSLYDLFLSNFIVLIFIAVSEFAIVGLFLRNFIEINQEFIAGMTVMQSDPNYAGAARCDFTREFLEGFMPGFIVNYFSKTNS